MIFLQLQQFLMAALDTTVTEQTVDHELLEADANGYKPTDTQKFQRPSCYEVIAKNEIEVIKLLSTGKDIAAVSRCLYILPGPLV